MLFGLSDCTFQPVSLSQEQSETKKYSILFYVGRWWLRVQRHFRNRCVCVIEFRFPLISLNIATTFRAFHGTWYTTTSGNHAIQKHIVLAEYLLEFVFILTRRNIFIYFYGSPAAYRVQQRN